MMCVQVSQGMVGQLAARRAAGIILEMVKVSTHPPPTPHPSLVPQTLLRVHADRRFGLECGATNQIAWFVISITSCTKLLLLHIQEFSHFSRDYETLMTHYVLTWQLLYVCHVTRPYS